MDPEDSLSYSKQPLTSSYRHPHAMSDQSVTFRNTKLIYAEKMSDFRPTPHAGGRPLSVVRDYSSSMSSGYAPQDGDKRRSWHDPERAHSIQRSVSSTLCRSEWLSGCCSNDHASQPDVAANCSYLHFTLPRRHLLVQRLAASFSFLSPFLLLYIFVTPPAARCLKLTQRRIHTSVTLDVAWSVSGSVMYTN
jgi:hypothetical protein